MNNSENPQQYLTNLKLSFSQLEQDLNNCPLSEILSTDYYKYYNLLTIFMIIKYIKILSLQYY